MVEKLRFRLIDNYAMTNAYSRANIIIHYVLRMSLTLPAIKFIHACIHACIAKRFELGLHLYPEFHISLFLPIDKVYCMNAAIKLITAEQ